MERNLIMVPSAKDEMRSFVFTPSEGNGPWPTVNFVMGGLGSRQTPFDMAQGLAANGCYVLSPDMFRRFGSDGPLEPAKVLTDPVATGEIFRKFLSSTGAEKSMRGLAA